jgi:hypothetical protein
MKMKVAEENKNEVKNKIRKEMNGQKKRKMKDTFAEEQN